MENTKTFWRVLIPVLLLGALLIGYSFIGSPDTQVEPEGSSSSEQEAGDIEVALSIEGLYESRVVPASKDESVLDLLFRLNNEDPGIELETKEYSGLGTLVTGFGGLENGADSRYWQYKVNGISPPVGADQYRLAEGDSIEWYFAESEF